MSLKGILPVSRCQKLHWQAVYLSVEENHWLTGKIPVSESEILDLISSSNSLARKKAAQSFGITLRNNSFYFSKKKILAYSSFICFNNFWRFNCLKSRFCCCSFYIHNLLKVREKEKILKTNFLLTILNWITPLAEFII